MDTMNAKTNLSVALINKKICYISATEYEKDFSKELCALRKTFFAKGKAKIKENGEYYGCSAKISGAMTGHSLRWKKTAGGVRVEEAFNTGGSFIVVRRDLNGNICGKIHYDKDHRWVKTEYFLPGNYISATAILKPLPSGDSTELFVYNEAGTNYISKILYPLPYKRGTAEQSLVNTKFGEPAVILITNEGEFSYCEKEEQKNRLQELEDIKADKGEPKWQAKEIEKQEEPKPEIVAKANEKEDNLPQVKGEASPIFSADLAAAKPLQVVSGLSLKDALETIGCEPALPEPVLPEPALPEPAQAMPVWQSPLGFKPMEMENADFEVDEIKPKETQNTEEINLEEPQEINSTEEKQSAQEIKSTEEMHSTAVPLILEEEAFPIPEFIFNKQEDKTQPEINQEDLILEREVSEEISGKAIKEQELFLPESSATIITNGQRQDYTGVLINGKREGLGRSATVKGSTIYEGEYKNGRQNGFGAAYSQEGKLTYAGFWKDDQKDGLGVSFRESDQAVNVCKRTMGKPENWVSLFDSKGNLKFTGVMEGAKKIGIGLCINDEQVQVGKYTGADAPQYSAIFNMQGSLIYYGEYKNKMRCGQGTEFNEDGTIVYSGEWKDNQYFNGVLYKK